MSDYKWQWTTHSFVLFGLTCDIFVDGQVAIMVDERTPNVGYLSQSLGEVVLTVTYGPDATFDELLERTLDDKDSMVSVIRERHPTQLCGYPAERVVIKIVPPPPPMGHRLGAEGIEPISGGYDAPFLLVMVSTYHRQTPLTAIFQKPLCNTNNASMFDRLEEHFFASFHCSSENEKGDSQEKIGSQENREMKT